MKYPLYRVFAALTLLLGHVLGAYAISGGEYQFSSPEDELRIPTPAKKRGNPCLSPEQSELITRLSGVSPLCEELKATSVPAGRAVGSDIVWVFPNRQGDYYYILAAHLPEDGSPPVTAWTGASLSVAIEQFCDREEGRPTPTPPENDQTPSPPLLGQPGWNGVELNPPAAD